MEKETKRSARPQASFNHISCLQPSILHIKKVSTVPYMFSQGYVEAAKQQIIGMQLYILGLFLIMKEMLGGRGAELVHVCYSTK